MSDFPPPTPPVSTASSEPPRSSLESAKVKPTKRKKWPLVFGGAGLFFAGVAVGAVGGQDDDPDAVATEESTREATEPVATDAPETTSAPTTTERAPPTSAPATTLPQTTTSTPTTTAAQATTLAPTNTAVSTTTAAPTTTSAPAPTAPTLTPGQQNAIESALSYLDFAAFSRLGLIDQLEFEQYSNADATFAVDYVNPDWNAQAVKSAEAYLDFTSFSCQGLINQLEFEQFTAEQATYGATQVGLC